MTKPLIEISVIHRKTTPLHLFFRLLIVITAPGIELGIHTTEQEKSRKK